MSYNILLGDLGPSMPVALTDDGAPFPLDAVNDTAVLRYQDPAGATHQVTLTITDAPNGALMRAWVNGDLPVVGWYHGIVKVTRSGDPTFPRSFPNDESRIRWYIGSTI